MGVLGGRLGSLYVEGVSLGQSPSPSSRCPSYPREMRRVKPATPKNRTRRRRRRFSTHSSPCSLSRRSAAAGLGTAHPRGERGKGDCMQAPPTPRPPSQVLPLLDPPPSSNRPRPSLSRLRPTLPPPLRLQPLSSAGFPQAHPEPGGPLPSHRRERR